MEWLPCTGSVAPPADLASLTCRPCGDAQWFRRDGWSPRVRWVWRSTSRAPPRRSWRWFPLSPPPRTPWRRTTLVSSLTSCWRRPATTMGKNKVSLWIKYWNDSAHRQISWCCDVFKGTYTTVTYSYLERFLKVNTSSTWFPLHGGNIMAEDWSYLTPGWTQSSLLKLLLPRLFVSTTKLHTDYSYKFSFDRRILSFAVNFQVCILMS